MGIAIILYRMCFISLTQYTCTNACTHTTATKCATTNIPVQTPVMNCDIMTQHQLAHDGCHQFTGHYSVHARTKQTS